MDESRELADPIATIAERNFGIKALFPVQRLVIANIIEAAISPGEDSRNRQIVILPTGAGKSLCFMIPALIVDGISVVVFPLLSLLSDQARRLTDCRIPYVILRGGMNTSEMRAALDKAEHGATKLVLTNPETLKKDAVIERLKALKISHFVVDETHTVSEWGDTFRPAYLTLRESISELDPVVVTAFTATASQTILSRIKEILFPLENPYMLQGNPDRPNIHYHVIPSIAKIRSIIQLINSGTAKLPAIVFCRSRTTTELVARSLQNRLGATRTFFYHAGLSRDEKTDVEEWFFSSKKGILVATCAYGMGVDKSNVRSVIHCGVPLSVEAYVQESGRAGRDTKTSNAFMLYGPDDDVYADKLSTKEGRVRYDGLLGYANDTTSCRRSMLMKMLSGHTETCFGCDVCNDSVKSIPDGYEHIMRVIGKKTRQLNLALARDFIGGRVSRRIKKNGIQRHVGFGILSQWTITDVEDALRLLIHCQALKEHTSWPWKGKLSVGRELP